MTRDDVNRVLRQMERVRELSYEAETKAAEKRLTREYKLMWQAIEPYVTNKIPYAPFKPEVTG